MKPIYYKQFSYLTMQEPMIIDTDELRGLLEAIRSAYGYDFTQYAEASIRRRVQHYMTTNKLGALAQLERIILDDEKQFIQFVQQLSVTVTEMFRDPGFYKCLREKVTKRLATYPFVKVWIAGCATGEEVYSVAILFREEGLLDRSVIYATDINQQSLQIARDGIYDAGDMRLYTQNYQKAGGRQSFCDYYKAHYNSVVFDKSLRQNIVFAPHNLAMERSFNEFQLIICRNVLIYFSQPLQDRVVNLFHESLCSLGFLGLGSKESLRFTQRGEYFEEVDRKEKIFMKIR